MLSRESRNENPEVQESNKWVKKLQQESWELELLVSGFSIVLLIKLTNWLQILLENVQFNLNLSINSSTALLFFLMFLVLASYALIINLIIHLVFRGFWVGIVGLGSVAPNTEFSKLKYSKFFTKKLEKKVSKLDELVVIVDKISSLIFTFAFLIIFFLISIGLFLVGIIVLDGFLSYFVDLTSGVLSKTLKFTTLIAVALYFLSGIIYLLDFLTLGFFKKYKWLSKIYYPIYKVFSWITLSFLYRTLYYNLISKFSKRKIGLILIPYLLIIIFVPLTNFSHHIYYPKDSENFSIYHNYYSDLRDKEDHIEKVDIPSYLVEGNLLPVFLKYNPDDNELIKKMNPDFIPAINQGINSKVKLWFGKRGLYIKATKFEDANGESLKCIASIYQIYLNDSLIISPKYYYKTSVNKGDKGIFTVLDILKLPYGENKLIVQKARFKKDSLIFVDHAFVPFWKE